MTGAPILHGQVHDLADLLGVGLRERAAEDGEVLGEDVDQAAVDAAVAGDDAVARDLLLVHAEVGAAVDDELVDLVEAARIEQELDALAGGHLALLVLALASPGRRRLRRRLRAAATPQVYVPDSCRRLCCSAVRKAMGPSCAIREAVWGMKTGRILAVFGVWRRLFEAARCPAVFAAVPEDGGVEAGSIGGEQGGDNLLFEARAAYLDLPELQVHDDELQLGVGSPPLMDMAT